MLQYCAIQFVGLQIHSQPEVQRPGVGLWAALVPPPAADAEARILLEGAEAPGPPLLQVLPAAHDQHVTLLNTSVCVQKRLLICQHMHLTAAEHVCHCGIGGGYRAVPQLHKGTCGGISESMASHSDARLSAAESMPARSSSSLVRCKVAAFQHYAAMSCCRGNLRQLQRPQQQQHRW